MSPTPARGLCLRVLTGLAVVLSPSFASCSFSQDARFRGLYERMQAALRPLPEKRPEGVDARLWEEAVRLTRIACANVCFDRRHVDEARMERFCRDLEAELRAGVDLRTLPWIWDRLEETGRWGQTYVRQNRPLFDEVLELIRQKQRAEPAPDRDGGAGDGARRPAA